MTTTSTAPTSSGGAQGLIVASLVLVAVVTAVSAASSWSDGGGFLITSYGVPLACAGLLALGVERANTGYLASLVVGMLAAVPLAWVAIIAMGAGPVLFAPPLLLLVAALVSWDHRRRARATGAGAG